MAEVKLDVTSDTLKKMKEDGVKEVITDWPLDSYDSITDPDEFKQLLKNANEVDIPVVVNWEPAFSNMFFNASEAKDDRYINYYIWRDSKGQNDTGFNEPPNNWVSLGLERKMLFFSCYLFWSAFCLKECLKVLFLNCNCWF